MTGRGSVVEKNGPWTYVAPAYVPRPLLTVPVLTTRRLALIGATIGATWRPDGNRLYGRNWRAEHRDEQRVYR